MQAAAARKEADREGSLSFLMRSILPAAWEKWPLCFHKGIVNFWRNLQIVLDFQEEATYNDKNIEYEFENLEEYFRKVISREPVVVGYR